jgi:hypothetical protein
MFGINCQKIKTSRLKETAVTIRACFQLNPQPCTRPTAIRHHFQGSVSQIKLGIHEARRVTPEAKAYMLKNLVKV